MNKVELVNQQTLQALNPELAKFRPGDTVKVHVWITEGDKKRIQIFEGVVMTMHNSGIQSSFTVRKVSEGVGVERIFPLYSPVIQKVEKASEGDVRRAKLYYLRELSGKKAKIKRREYKSKSRPKASH